MYRYYTLGWARGSMYRMQDAMLAPPAARATFPLPRCRCRTCSASRGSAATPCNASASMAASEDTTPACATAQAGTRCGQAGTGAGLLEINATDQDTTAQTRRIPLTSMPASRTRACCGSSSQFRREASGRRSSDARRGPGSDIRRLQPVPRKHVRAAARAVEQGWGEAEPAHAGARRWSRARLYAIPVPSCGRRSCDVYLPCTLSLLVCSTWPHLCSSADSAPSAPSACSRSGAASASHAREAAGTDGSCGGSRAHDQVLSSRHGWSLSMEVALAQLSTAPHTPCHKGQTWHPMPET